MQDILSSIPTLVDLGLGALAISLYKGLQTTLSAMNHTLTDMGRRIAHVEARVTTLERKPRLEAA